MTRLRALVAAFALAAGMLTATAPPAEAQSTYYCTYTMPGGQCLRCFWWAPTYGDIRLHCYWA